MNTIRLGSTEVSVEELEQLVKQIDFEELEQLVDRVGRESLPEEGRKKLLAMIDILSAVAEQVGVSIGELNALVSDYAAREGLRSSAKRVNKD